MKIMVYGTLRRRCGNDGLLITSTFIETRSVGGYYMFSNLSFPYAIPSRNETDTIVGEIYEVDDETLAALDKLEGVAYGHYTREPVNGMDDVFMYIPTDMHRVVQTCMHVPTGDWIDGIATADRIIEEYYQKNPDKRPAEYHVESAAS